MRKLVLGILGFAAIGMGAASLQPAQAQPYYPGSHRQGVVEGQYRGEREDRGYRRGRWSGEYRGYRPAFAPGPYRGGYREGDRRPHGYYRPVFAGPTCFVRMQRVWNGWRWVQQPVRICR